MMNEHMRRMTWLLVAVLPISACGGGGSSGTQVASVSAPPPAPPPPPPPAIKIFANPEPATYTAVGASIAGPGGNLDTYETADIKFGTISTDPAQQAQIRYLADGNYEVKMPGQDWDKLVPYKGLGNPDTETNNYFQPAGVKQNYGYLGTSNSRFSGYSYAELGWWGSDAAKRSGVIAFGVPTAADGVPTSGSATFAGLIQGTADITQPDFFYGGYVTMGVEGTVQLSLDFGAGRLSGSMNFNLNDGAKTVALGTYAFKDSLFSRSTASYSAAFDTTVSGQNFILGQLFGPTAIETGGAWALPFRFTQTGLGVAPDNQTHQAYGGFLAKRP